MEKYYPHIIRICREWIAVEENYQIMDGSPSPHFEPGQIAIMKSGPLVLIGSVEIFGGYGEHASEVYTSDKLRYTVYYQNSKYTVRETELCSP